MWFLFSRLLALWYVKYPFTRRLLALWYVKFPFSRLALWYVKLSHTPFGRCVTAELRLQFKAAVFTIQAALTLMRILQVPVNLCIGYCSLPITFMDSASTIEREYI